MHFKTMIEVLTVDTLCPPIAQFLSQRTAGKVEPALVEEITEFVFT